MTRLIKMIAEFNPLTIKDNSLIIVSSARKSGKTFLVSYIVKEMRKKFAAAYVISKTSQLQDSFSFIDKRYHIDPKSDGEFEFVLNRILEFQKARKESGEKVGQILLIMDDLFISSTSGSGRYSKSLARIAATGRHLNCLVFLITQRWQSLSPSVRSQCSIYISFKPRSLNERRMMIKEFLSRQNSMSRTETNRLAGDVLKSVFEGEDPEFRALLVQNESRSTLPQDYVYSIKAPPLTKWKLKLQIIPPTVSVQKNFLNVLP